MKILLVYPEFPDTFWSFKHALKFVHKKAGAPPLGLLTVAAMLPSEWDKRLADLNVANLTEEDLTWADYVFISAMIVQRKSARTFIHRCKLAGVKVVAGGPLFTMEHEQFPDVDYFVLNEAELTSNPSCATWNRVRLNTFMLPWNSPISTKLLHHFGVWLNLSITTQSVFSSRAAVLSTATSAM